MVDYFGVARHLKEALAAYSAEDVEGALRSLKDEIPKLRDRHQRVVALFLSRGIEDLDDTERVRRAPRGRAPARRVHRQAQALPHHARPRAPAPRGPCLREGRQDADLHPHARAEPLPEGMPVLGKEVGAKVRKLIDEHVISLGIDPKIPPISITDAEFAEHVEKQVSPRAKASEMEHALRYHIRKHLHEDPEHYQKLSERLEEILEQFGENWEQLVLALRSFVEEVEAGRQQDETGLDPRRRRRSSPCSRRSGRARLPCRHPISNGLPG